MQSKSSVVESKNREVATFHQKSGPLSLASPTSLLARITLECCRVSEYWKLAFPLGNAS